MHPADAAGGEDADAGHAGDDHGGGHSGGTVGLPGDQHRQIPAAGLGDAAAGFAEILNLFTAEPGLQAAADDGDGGGNGAVVPEGLLHPQGGFHVLGIGHAVGDDGALQGDDWPALLQGLGHFGRHVKMLIQVGVSFVHALVSSL